MFLIFKILLVALLHLAVFLCYPETGPYGNLFLIISTLAWSVILVVMNANLKFIKLLSGAAGLLFNLAFFAVMLLAIAFIMPQRDGVSVREKIRKRQFPDRTSLNTGLIKLGVNYRSEVKKDIKGLDLGIQKALKKIEKD